VPPDSDAAGAFVLLTATLHDRFAELRDLRRGGHLGIVVLGPVLGRRVRSRDIRERRCTRRSLFLDEFTELRVRDRN